MRDPRKQVCRAPRRCSFASYRSPSARYGLHIFSNITRIEPFRRSAGRLGLRSEHCVASKSHRTTSKSPIALSEVCFFAHPMASTCPTEGDGITGELVYVDRGTADDFHGRDVNGKIVLSGVEISGGHRRRRASRYCWDNRLRYVGL